MEFFDQIGWLLFVGMMVYFALRSQIKAGPDDTVESNEVRLQLQNSMNRIYSSWDFDTLKETAQREIHKFPKHQAWIMHAYNQQHKFLSDFHNGYRYAVERVKAIVHHQLEQCRSIEEFQALQNAFGDMIQVSPQLSNLFENYRLWFYRHEADSSEYSKSSRFKETRRTQRNKKKDLFSKCSSLDEVKQRFRRLAFLNHPDRGGKEAAMKEVLRQYEEALSNFQ